MTGKVRIAITDDKRILCCRLLIRLIELCGAEPVIIGRRLRPSSVGIKGKTTGKKINSKALSLAKKEYLDNVKKILDSCDAVIIPGNRNDVHPKEYNETKIHPATKKNLITNPLDIRFEVESFMASYAIFERPIPILAICGGFQVINVLLGGSLIQHLPHHPRINEKEFSHRELKLHHLPHKIQTAWEKEFPKHLDCGKPANIFPATHNMKVTDGSLLAAIYKKSDPKINLDSIGELSMHHQGCFKENMGKGLKAVAFAPDGLVEAMELEKHPMCLLTQFHLEYNVSNIAKITVQTLIDRCSV